MSEQMQDNLPENEVLEPIIPPLFLILASAALVILAFVVAFTNPSNTIIIVGSLIIAVMCLIGWAVIAPDQLRSLITGRAVRYGGTSVLVTLVVIVALIALYTLIAGQNWTLELTENEVVTLTESSRDVIETLGADPNLPNIRILAFYGISEAGRRDRDEILFEDYASTSDGKIDYEFIDPERNPLRAGLYDVNTGGAVVVVALNDEGEPDTENAEALPFFSQEQLTNAIVAVASTGDFRGYFLSVEDGLQLESNEPATSLGQLNTFLTETFKWTTEQISVLQLGTEEPNLQDPAADGILLVIPGGTEPLSDGNFQLVADYLTAGGDALILADIGIQDNGFALATAENITNFLTENYGVAFSPTVVLDPIQQVGAPFNIIASDFDQTNLITREFANIQGASTLFELGHNLVIAEEVPENVIVTPLVQSSSQSFLKAIDDLNTQTGLQRTDSDIGGPFPMVVAVENTETGSRLVLVGNTSSATNAYAELSGANIYNFEITLLSTLWATNFDEFFQEIPQVTREGSPQDTPIFADNSTLSSINFITVIAMPFGMLIIGIGVLWFNRRRGRVEA